MKTTLFIVVRMWETDYNDSEGGRVDADKLRAAFKDPDLPTEQALPIVASGPVQIAKGFSVSEVQGSELLGYVWPEWVWNRWHPGEEAPGDWIDYDHGDDVIRGVVLSEEYGNKPGCIKLKKKSSGE